MSSRPWRIVDESSVNSPRTLRWLGEKRWERGRGKRRKGE
jgi:hypothetical protein